MSIARSRRSILATPESDPFSSGGIRSQPGIHDPTRLSVYSSSSMSDIGPKKNDFDRSSYASSSSHSHRQGVDLSPKLSANSLPASIDAIPASPMYEHDLILCTFLFTNFYVAENDLIVGERANTCRNHLT